MAAEPGSNGRRCWAPLLPEGLCSCRAGLGTQRREHLPASRSAAGGCQQPPKLHPSIPRTHGNRFPSLSLLPGEVAVRPAPLPPAQ